MVRQVTKEKCDVFSGNADDIGDVRSHPMKINLKDDHPVQLNCNSVPRHLYNELKMYIEDLLNKRQLQQFLIFITSCCSAKEGWDNEALL